MPHKLFELSWAEWAAIIAIISGVFVGFDHMLKSFKESIIEPFSEQMNKSIDKLTESSGVITAYEYAKIIGNDASQIVSDHVSDKVMR